MRLDKNNKYINICEFENCYSIGIIEKEYAHKIEIDGMVREIPAPGAGEHFVLEKDQSSMFHFYPGDDEKAESLGRFIREWRKKEAAIFGSTVDHRQWVLKSTKVMLC